jgi:hypothetical protein
MRVEITIDSVLKLKGRGKWRGVFSFLLNYLLSHPNGVSTRLTHTHQKLETSFLVPAIVTGDCLQ